jgi:carboxyl-terminal processing protease
MVVLVNSFSASASEIVAGALQDYGRAVVVGSEHTHGKGTVQVIMDLDKSLTLRNMKQYMPLGALKMTTQKFYRVSGDSTQYRGVVPDVVLPDRSKYSEYGERYLDYSLPWDRIEEVEHKEWPPVDRVLLNVKSRKRVSGDEDFTQILQLAETMQVRIKNTEHSLLLEGAIKERDEVEDMTSIPHGGFAGPAVFEEDENKEGNEDEGLSAQEKLLKQVSGDVYVKESMAILLDMIDLQPELARKTEN